MKVGRQSKILELIGTYDIETQEELAELLTKAGYHVTQATISRDIRELKLTKAVSAEGKQKYIALKGEDSNLNGKYIRILKDAFISMNKAQNIMVIKTVSGMAMAAAAALDILNIEGIVKSGPAVGIMSEYIGPYTINTGMEEWDLYVEEGDRLLLVGSDFGTHTIGYLYKDVVIANSSTLSTPTFGSPWASPTRSGRSASGNCLPTR